MDVRFHIKAFADTPYGDKELSHCFIDAHTARNILTRLGLYQYGKYFYANSTIYNWYNGMVWWKDVDEKVLSQIWLQHIDPIKHKRIAIKIWRNKKS